MKKMRQPKQKDLIASMLLSVALAMIFTQIVGQVALIVDGIVTSRFIGSEAYSAVSLFSPVISTILLFSTFISTGCQVVGSKDVGTGKRESANGVFSFSLLLGLAVSVVVILCCLLIPNALFAVCGVSVNTYPQLRPYMMDYMNGFLIGIPFMIMIQIMGPMIVLDGGKKRFTLSSGVFGICVIAADIIAAAVLKAGTFGMGMATSVSYVIQFVILILHFLKKGSYFKLRHTKSDPQSRKEMLKAGTPAFVRKLFVILRDLITNHINIAVAVSAAAIAARGMQHDLNLLMFCIGLGMGRALLTITGIFHSANDRQGLKRLFTYSIKLSVQISGTVGVLVFLLAPLISRIYTSDPEVISLSVFSIRCLALALPLDTLACAYQNYLQGINNRKLVNAFSFFERFLVPVLTALLMGTLFGSKGVLASLAAGKLLLAIIMFFVIWIHCKHFPRHIEDYMYLDESFGGKESDNLYARILNMDDVIREKDKAEDFCLKHGVDAKKAALAALFIEEMAGNIIEHGKSKTKAAACADYRLFISDDKISITLRDYCLEFDPTKYYELNKDDNEMAIGIRMVSNLASDVRYFNAFNSNNIIILLDK